VRTGRRRTRRRVRRARVLFSVGHSTVNKEETSID
jgi:hypothetical protein